MKSIVEALERYADGDLSEQSIHQVFKQLRKLESRRDPVSKPDIDESEWLRAAAHNPAYAFLGEPREDMYTLADGKPFHDAR